MRDLRREYTEVELDGLFDRNPNVNEDLSDLEGEFEEEYRIDNAYYRAKNIYEKVKKELDREFGDD